MRYNFIAVPDCPQPIWQDKCRIAFRSRTEGVLRQLAAAFMPHLIGIERINRVFKEGASKLAHSKEKAPKSSLTLRG
jgi:hypothetical protein